MSTLHTYRNPIIPRRCNNCLHSQRETEGPDVGRWECHLDGKYHDSYDSCDQHKFFNEAKYQQSITTYNKNIMDFSTRFTLWLNERKDPNNPKHPDYRGIVKLGDTECEITCWYSETKQDGSACSPHFSCSLKPRQAYDPQGGAQPMQAPGRPSWRDPQPQQTAAVQPAPAQSRGADNDGCPF